jgi:hypothetical protein
MNEQRRRWGRVEEFLKLLLSKFDSLHGTNPSAMGSQNSSPGTSRRGSENKPGSLSGTIVSSTSSSEHSYVGILPASDWARADSSPGFRPESDTGLPIIHPPKPKVKTRRVRNDRAGTRSSSDSSVNGPRQFRPLRRAKRLTLDAEDDPYLGDHEDAGPRK